MSFTLQKSKYGSLSSPAGVSPLEKEFLSIQKRPPINEDHAVEILIDDIRSTSCQFHFRMPLGQNFDEARDHAINCLELSEVPPRMVHHWVGDCLKCMDVLLVVYMRDVLKSSIPKKGKWPKERDVYDRYESSAEDDLQLVGSRLNAVYQKRSDPLEHHQLVDENGHRQIRRVSSKRRMETYFFAREYVKQSLDVVVLRYRKAYPMHCDNAGK